MAEAKSLQSLRPWAFVTEAEAARHIKREIEESFRNVMVEKLEWFALCLIRRVLVLCVIQVVPNQKMCSFKLDRFDSSWTGPSRSAPQKQENKWVSQSFENLLRDLRPLLRRSGLGFGDHRLDSFRLFVRQPSLVH